MGHYIDRCITPTRDVAIRTDIQKIHHHLGVCPQFDIQLADMTSEEHLLFYARLKGVNLNGEGRRRWLRKLSDK